MANTVENGEQERERLNILDTDGQPHPVQDLLTIITLALGLISFVLGLIIRNVHGTAGAVVIIATSTGLVSILVGLYVQMVSATRNQRILIVTGMIAGFVGVAMGLSQGGFLA